MLSFLSLLIALPYSAAANAQDTRVDDGDLDDILYLPKTVDWQHDANQGDPFSSGTISYTNAADAYYQFTCVCDSFDLWVGLKQDRGKFVVSVDGVFAGSGDNFGSNANEITATSQFHLGGLDHVSHTVVVQNLATNDARIPSGGQPFLAVDFVQWNQVQANASSSQASSSQTSSQSDSTSSSAPSQGVKQASASHSGPIAGGVIAGVAAILLLAASAGWLWLRKRKRMTGPGWQATTQVPISATVTHYGGSYLSTPNATETLQPLMTHARAGQSPSSPTSTRTLSNVETIDETDANQGQQPPSYDQASSSSGLRAPAVSSTRVSTSATASPYKGCI